MRVLVAPDSFAGTLSAGEAAAAIADGWQRAAPRDEIRRLPLSDGGPGFVAAVHAATGGQRRPIVVTGPLGEPVPAEVLLVPAACDPSGRESAYVESAQACGLHLVPADRRDPRLTTTAGVGELLAQALVAGATRVVVGLGGSATVDGGAGLLGALGALVPGRTGPGGPAGEAIAEDLAGLAGVRDRLRDVDLVVASDVDAPLLGPTGAALGYSRQKGASPAVAADLEQRMHAWATVLGAAAAAAGQARAERLADAPGAGAAGGLGLALLALGARRVPGAQEVADVTGLATAARDCDLVLTGEGCFDWQSLRGKVAVAVARAAQSAAVPVVVVAGQVLVGRRELAAAGVDAAYAVAETPDEVAAAMAAPWATLAARAGRVAATWSR